MTTVLHNFAGNSDEWAEPFGLGSGFNVELQDGTLIIQSAKPHYEKG